MSGIDDASNETIDDIAAEPTNRIISGFWRRFLAFFIDSLILGLAGIFIGSLYYDFFAQLGIYGRVVGFAIALTYFGILNSSRANGKTIGKTIMGIEVVDVNGAYISLPRSLVRYVILGSPFFLNYLPLAPSTVMSPRGFLIGLILFGGGGAIIYLIIFNRRTRQSLHDLIVKSYVVKVSPQGQLTAPSIWKYHLVIVGVWVFIVIASSVAIAYITPSIGALSELSSVQNTIISTGKANSASAFTGKGFGTSNGEKWESTYFTSTVNLKTEPDDYEKVAVEIASAIIFAHPEIMNKDHLAVTVVYGFDLGIARAWENWTVGHTPQEWEEILNQTQTDLNKNSTNP